MDFDSEQIIDMLESGNIHFRKIASKAIVDNFALYSSIFFDYLTNEKLRNDLVDIANQRFVSLIAGFDKASLADTNKEYFHFSELAGEHTLFLSKLKEYIIQNEENRIQLLNNLYTLFPGIRPDLSNDYPSYTFTIEQEKGVESQLMLFVTGNCNLNCPYCFSNTLERREMSLPAIECLLQWAHTNHIKRITLCGGEPALHSHFDSILSMIGAYGFTTYFASNMLADYTLFSSFNYNIVNLVYAHITNPVLKDDTLKEQFMKNCLYTKEQEIKLVFRTNIEDRNPDIDGWFDIMSETGGSKINIALTFPSGNLQNCFVDVHSFQEYTGIISRIVRKAYANGIQLSFAKPIPLCLFDKEMQRFLLSNQGFHPMCGTHHRNYTHNVCIYPDLTIRSCLGISDSFMTFNKDISWQVVEDFCTQAIRPLLHKPLFETCPACFLYDRKLCQGSCLSYKNIS